MYVLGITRLPCGAGLSTRWV